MTGNGGAMILLVGLGNPGTEYKFTRHNIGFLALDEIHESYTFSPWKSKFKGLVSEGTIGTHTVLLLKPQTYMNLSGQSVSETMQFYKIPLENVVVIHDDLDLAPKTLRMKQGGSAGGHNGLKDIDQRLGVNYWRIRLGIGHPRTLKPEDSPAHEGNVTNYVLGKFSKQDAPWLGALLDSVSHYMPLFLDEEREKFVQSVIHDLSTIK
jgi:PTH1 family peptidyl-tRNA hydrolase